MLHRRADPAGIAEIVTEIQHLQPIPPECRQSLAGPVLRRVVTDDHAVRQPCLRPQPPHAFQRHLAPVVAGEDDGHLRAVTLFSGQAHDLIFSTCFQLFATIHSNPSTSPLR